MPTEELIAKNEKAKREWILEVDLENPVDLHKDHMQWLTTYPRKKENRKRIDLILSKTDGGWVGIQTEWEQTGFEVAREEKLRSFITEICSAVLSEALGETERWNLTKNDRWSS